MRDLGPGRRAHPRPVAPAGGGGVAARAAHPHSTRTTPTTRATRTAPTRTTSWTARCRSRGSCSTMMPFFVTPPDLHGRGQGRRRRTTPSHCEYQISQRADFLETEVGLETMHIAAHHQHPRRAARRSREVPAPARHRRRRQHEPRSPPTSRWGRWPSCSAWWRTTSSTATCRSTGRSAPSGVVSRDLACRETIRLKDGRTISAVDHPARVSRPSPSATTVTASTSRGCAT